MKIFRYEDPAGAIHHGCRRADGPDVRIEGDVLGAFRLTNEPARVARILAPLSPVQILCIGLNYRRHAIESGAAIPDRPVLFAKGINTTQHPDGAIELPVHLKSEEVDYECELAVVIGKSCKNVSRAEALNYVLGYTCCNDVSARDWQLKLGGGQWCRGKFFDTFCPLGPVLVTRDEIPDPNNLALSTRLNGATVQSANTSDMIFPVAALIEFLSSSTTLPAGTVILTGTPPGVGMAQKPPRWLRPGDVVEVEIERIGTLSNPVVAETIRARS